MRYRYYESNPTKKILTYCLYVILVGWLLATVTLGYQYLIQNSQKTTKKGGTFVEAIFNQVSYLPYLKNDWQSLFYQSFLFDACISYATLEKEGLKWENCKITTQDYQTYYISLPNEPKNWSDGTNMSIEDIYFTYEKILRSNIWDIKTLTTYQDVKVSLEADQKIKIIFPTSTTDNNLFFTAYILPKHVLEYANLEMYKTIFAANPVTSWCGKIAPKSSDPQSLVFDLTKCEDTNLAFYQIKNYENFETLAKSVIENQNTLVDAYANQITLEWYQRVNITKSQILTAFFNTKSDKMKVRLRRALGGLINSQFYTGEYSTYLKKYEEELLTLFYSDGSNIKEFINRLGNPEEIDGVQQEDLRDSGIQELKKSITINGVERKFVFFTQKPTNNIFNLEIKFSNQFESISIKDNYKNTFTPKNYKKTDKKITYPLEVNKNLKEGLNQYTIIGTIKGKTYTIANIDLYLLSSQAPIQNNEDEQMKTKIKVIYYNNLESNFAIKQLRDLLTKAGILENFLFEQISSPEILEGKIILWEYDILLNTINIGMKKDILKILTTNDSLINPSRYTNPLLTNLFKQYTKSPQKSEISSEINKIFAQDMPFVILGYPFDFINIKKTLLETSFSTGDNQDLYEYNRRNQLYKNLILVQNTVIDFSKLKDIDGFISSVFNLIQPISIPNTTVQETPPEAITHTGLTGTISTGQQEQPLIIEWKPTINTNNPFEGLVKPIE